MKINTTDILLIALVALVTWNVRGCFTKVQKPEEMIRNEERIKYIEKEIAEVKNDLVEKRVQYDSVNSLLMKKDTVIVTKLITNDKKIKDVINSVRDASKDELRSYRPED